MPAAPNYDVSLLSKAVFGDIGQVPYSIWSYRVSWSIASQKLSPRIGLTLSSKLDIKFPSDYPAVQAIQGTHILRVSSDDKQYIFREVDPSKIAQLDLVFLAPGVEDGFTPVQFGTAVPEAGPWRSLPFRVDGQNPAAMTQTMRGPAIVSAPASSAPRLDNSSRRVEKVTLVSMRLDPLPDDNGAALLKFGFVRQLGLQAGEVNAARTPMHGTIRDLLRQFEGAPIPSQLPSPTNFASMSMNSLRAFGQSVLALRRQVHDAAVMAVRPASTALTVTPSPAEALNAVNAATVALNAFEANFSVTPIGMLNLERIEMTPVGVERGGLIATIPLAPLEKTAVVHTEWSVTSREFTSIVTDSLENVSETGVTENTELAQSTQAQTSHSNQFNVNGTVTGTYGPVTATVSSGFTAQNQNSDSANESRKHAITTTRQASSRVKQEHKVTISTSTVTGTSETSTRMLENSSPTDPIRIDYFSIMRKWHVGLYRYGLRLTYDFAIPEPGAAMRKVYADLENLGDKVGKFDFPVLHGEITADILPGETQPHYLVLADLYKAQVPSPPAPPAPIIVSASVPGLGGGIHNFQMTFDVPAGYWLKSMTLDATVTGPTGVNFDFAVLASSFFMRNQPDTTYPSTLLISRANGRNFMEHVIGSQTVTFFFNDANTAMVSLTIETEAISPGPIDDWKSEVWNALYNAAQTQHFAEQQDIQNQISALQDKINNVDTLTLRREENEEIMKGVLRWLLGPSFDFMPDDVTQIFTSQQNMDLKHGTTFDQTIGDGLNVTAAGWYPMFMYQEMVKFINEAIEWENVLYFLYSYFWDIPAAWPFIRDIRHPDSTRQAFLRAGSARVVLTVRKGWESAWVQFVEAGGFGQTLLPGHPYMTIAAQIQAYDATNYPGIPPANPGGGPLPDSGDSVATVCRNKLQPSGTPVTIAVDSSAGFVVGYTATIDDYMPGSNVQENQTITAVPDGTHITVAGLTNAHDGTLKPLPVFQAGEKGVLIAEWFEYTPTSGTDIAVTSNLASIA